MPSWKKSILVFSVLAGHVGVLIGLGICTTSRTEGRSLPPSTTSPSKAMWITSDIYAQKGNGTDGISSLSPGTYGKGDRSRPVPAIQVGSQYGQDSDTYPPPAKESRPFDSKVFLMAGDVDVTAIPSTGFDDALQQRLGPISGSIGIEFWIDETGKTVKVTCFESDCPASLESGLNTRFDVRFQPATKDGFPVPSRKLILLETSQSF